MEPTPRPWYKKKRYLIPLASLGLYGAALASSGPSAPAAQAPVQEVTPVQVQTSTQSQDANTLSHDSTYTNVSGNTVPSPVHLNTCTGSAICGDGTCSFSQHRQGTCSHHGGVAEWL